MLRAYCVTFIGSIGIMGKHTVHGESSKKSICAIAHGFSILKQV